MLNQIKCAYERLPSWVSSILWVSAIYVLFWKGAPASDWIYDHPTLFVAMIGAASYLMFLFGFAWDLRFGQDALSEIRIRIGSRTSEPDEPQVILWIVIGALVIAIVAIAVAAFTISSPRSDTKPILVAVVGGLVAGGGAPFLIVPSLAFAGALRGPSRFVATFVATLAAPRPNALQLRSQLERKPQPLGLTHLRPIVDGQFRADAVRLSHILMRSGTTYSATLHDERHLEVASWTDGGDRETTRMFLNSEQVIEVEVEVVCRGAWSRGFLILAGKHGYARLVTDVETAVLGAMLNTKVVSRNLGIAAPDKAGA